MIFYQTCQAVKQFHKEWSMDKKYLIYYNYPQNPPFFSPLAIHFHQSTISAPGKWEKREFSLLNFTKKTYVVTPYENCLTETVLMRGHNKSFHREILIIIPELTSKLHLIWGSGTTQTYLRIFCRSCNKRFFSFVKSP